MTIGQYESHVAKIDRKVGVLLKKDIIDQDIMVSMLQYMPKLKVAMDNLSNSQLRGLCQKYGNFHYYMRVLENIAQGLANGQLKLPF